MVELLRIGVYILLAAMTLLAIIAYIHIKLHKGWEMFVDIRIYDPFYDSDNVGRRLTEKEELLFAKQIAKKFNISLERSKEAIYQSRMGNSKWFRQFNRLQWIKHSKNSL